MRWNAGSARSHRVKGLEGTQDGRGPSAVPHPGGLPGPDAFSRAAPDAPRFRCGPLSTKASRPRGRRGPPLSTAGLTARDLCGPLLSTTESRPRALRGPPLSTTESRPRALRGPPLSTAGSRCSGRSLTARGLRGPARSRIAVPRRSGPPSAGASSPAVPGCLERETAFRPFWTRSRLGARLSARGRLRRKRTGLFSGNRQVTCLNSRDPLIGAPLDADAPTLAGCPAHETALRLSGLSSPSRRDPGLRGRLHRKCTCLFLGNRQVTCLNGWTPFLGPARGGCVHAG